MENLTAKELYTRDYSVGVDDRFTDITSPFEFIEKCVRVCYGHSDGYTVILDMLEIMLNNFQTPVIDDDVAGIFIDTESCYYAYQQAVMKVENSHLGSPCLLWNEVKWMACKLCHLIVSMADNGWIDHEDVIACYEQAARLEINSLRDRLFHSRSSRNVSDASEVRK